jgi:hypothetical protein
VGTTEAVTWSAILLFGAGLLPAATLFGLRPVTFSVAPLGGAVLAGLAAAACLGIGGSTRNWFVVLAGGVNVLAAATGLRSASWRPWRRPPGAPLGAVPAAVAGLLLLAATVFSVVALRAPSIGFDARTIWMLHAAWFAAGHHVALAALGNRALPFAHSTYPPLVGGAVALGWVVTGNHSYAVGVALIAVLNACALFSAAWALVEVGGLCGRPAGAERATRSPSWSVGLGLVVAVLLVFVAAGVFGPFMTNGYADPLWATSAVGAVIFGLMLPTSTSNLGVAALLVACAGLTKSEGTATAVVIVVLIGLRLGAHRYAERRAFPAGVAVGTVLGIAFLAAWPILCHFLHAAPNVANLGTNVNGRAGRARLTFTTMAAHLHVVPLALAVAVVGAATLRRRRRRAALGNDLFAWAALAVGALLVGVAYVSGPGNVTLWLDTSAHRTTFFPALVGWWVIGVWAVLAASALAGSREGSSGSALDARRGVVLHHRT